MRIEKGGVLLTNWYYVIVSIVYTEGDIWLNCICDNANNIYSFSLSEIKKEKFVILTGAQALYLANWSSYQDLEEKDIELIQSRNRPIPVDVITEVLVGIHDDRFGPI